MNSFWHFVLGTVLLAGNNIHQGFCVEISEKMTNLNLALYGQCPIEINLKKNDTVPTFALCDPDNVFKHDDNEIRLQTENIMTCQAMSRIANATDEMANLKTLLIYVDEVIVIGGHTTKSPLDLYRDIVIEAFNLSSIPSYLVIIQKGNKFRVLEWFSKPLQKLAAHLPSQDDNRTSLYDHGNMGHKSNKVIIIISFQVICDTILEMFDPPDWTLLGSYKILWILFALIISVGLFTFCCWVYRFNKHHPTDDDDDADSKSDDGRSQTDIQANIYVLEKMELKVVPPEKETDIN